MQKIGLPPEGLPPKGLHLQAMPIQGLPLQGLQKKGLPPEGLPHKGLPQKGLQIKGTRHDIALDHHGLETGQMVSLGVRPEDLLLDQGEISLDARLLSRELLGADQVARFDIGANDPLIARVHNVERLVEGRRYQVGLRTEDIHLFDGGSGERIEIFRDKAAN